MDSNKLWENKAAVPTSGKGTRQDSRFAKTDLKLKWEQLLGEKTHYTHCITEQGYLEVVAWEQKEKPLWALEKAREQSWIVARQQEMVMQKEVDHLCMCILDKDSGH